MGNRSSDIVARLALNAEAFSAENARVFGEMEQRAASSAARLKSAFDSNFSQIQSLAKKALTLPRTDTGALNLDPSAARAAAAAAESEAVALREIATAARQAAINTGDTTQATRLYVQAAAAAAVEAEGNARELGQQAIALERLQAELGRTNVLMADNDNMGRKVTASAGAQRAGMQQLGMQLGDMATMWSMNAPPMQIFTSQASQVVGSLSLMTNSTKGFLGFIGGPWGQVITTGAIVLTVLADKMWNTGEAADSTSGKLAGQVGVVNRLTAAYDGLAQAMNKAGAKAVEAQGLAMVKLRQDEASVERLRTAAAQAEARLQASKRVDPKGRGSAPLLRDVEQAKSDLRFAEQQLATSKNLTVEFEKRRKIAEQAAREVDKPSAGKPRSTRAAEAREVREALKLETSLLGARAGAQGNVQKLAAEAMERQQEWGKDQITVGETLIDQARDLESLDEARAEGARQILEYNLRQLDAMQRMGGAAGTVAGIVAGITDGGNFLGVPGSLGKALNLISPTVGQDGWKAIEEKLDEIFGGSGTFANTMKDLLQGMALGQVGSSIVGGGGRAGSLLGGLGGVLGKELLGGTLSKGLGSLASGALGKTLGALGGPLGGIIGGALGGIVGGLFKPAPKYGTARLQMNQYGELEGGSASGNDGASKRAASGLASSVADGLMGIADQLGAKITNVPTNIVLGTFDGKYRVNTEGRGGKMDFKGNSAKGLHNFGDDQQAAIEFAIQKSIEGSVITGISKATENILKSGQDLDRAMQKALMIESIPKELQRRLDPVGYAIDEVNRKWERTVDALREGGATAEQMADAQKLYNMEMAEAKENAGEASQSLKDFIKSMNMGSSSPLSLRDQEENARKVLDPYLGQIARGETIDQDKYLSAAQTFLDIERQLYGSTAKYFEAFDMIQGATGSAISKIDNAAPIRTTSDPFNETTAQASQATAANTSNMSAKQDITNDLLRQVLDKLEKNGATWTGSLRNYA
ncbi:hypothetical protein [Sphingobium agri]|uniref:Bacteriophage tail tape measure N-terminal domain-containing protein n=1 Tax=Sphingobium agri TaxID=2933566 RepID=A0ABT0E209_9SPHN|nr:hypothetical protein [Sphingobium agri]MCK0533400.1 hypothetical protein [Sphingobium agri]